MEPDFTLDVRNDYAQGGRVRGDVEARRRRIEFFDRWLRGRQSVAWRRGWIAGIEAAQGFIPFGAADKADPYSTQK